MPFKLITMMNMTTFYSPNKGIVYENYTHDNVIVHGNANELTLNFI